MTPLLVALVLAGQAMRPVVGFNAVSPSDACLLAGDDDCEMVGSIRGGVAGYCFDAANAQCLVRAGSGVWAFKDNAGATFLTLTPKTGNGAGLDAAGGELVINDDGNDENVRIEGVSAPNLVVVDAGDKSVTVTSGTLATTKQSFAVSGTFAAAAGVEQLATFITTQTGNNGLNIGLNSTMTGSWTGQDSRAIQATQISVGTGQGVWGTVGTDLGNIGVLAQASGVASGFNTGFRSEARGSSTQNLGVLGFAHNAGALNIGVAGTATEATLNVGGYFAIKVADDFAAPTPPSAAIVATNLDTTSPIIVAQDGATTAFIVADGGLVGAHVASPVSYLDSGGSFGAAIANLSTTTTLDATHFTAAVDASGGAVTINLPSCVAGISRRMYAIKKIDPSGNAVTIDPASTQTIDGSATKALTLPNSSVIIQCNAGAAIEWAVLAAYASSVVLNHGEVTAEVLDLRARVNALEGIDWKTVLPVVVSFILLLLQGWTEQRRRRRQRERERHMADAKAAMDSGDQARARDHLARAAELEDP